MIDHAGLIAARIFMAFLPWKQRLLIAWWRPSDVIEDLLDGAGIGNIGDDPQSATTLWTDRNIDIEYSLEPLCPGERSDERVLLRGVVGCFVCFVICLSAFLPWKQRLLIAWLRHRVSAQFTHLPWWNVATVSIRPARSDH